MRLFKDFKVFLSVLQAIVSSDNSLNVTKNEDFNMQCEDVCFELDAIMQNQEEKVSDDLRLELTQCKVSDKKLLIKRLT